MLIWLYGCFWILHCFSFLSLIRKFTTLKRLTTRWKFYTEVENCITSIRTLAKMERRHGLVHYSTSIMIPLLHAWMGAWTALLLGVRRDIHLIYYVVFLSFRIFFFPVHSRDGGSFTSLFFFNGIYTSILVGFRAFGKSWWMDWWITLLRGFRWRAWYLFYLLGFEIFSEMAWCGVASYKCSCSGSSVSRLLGIGWRNLRADLRCGTCCRLEVRNSRSIYSLPFAKIWLW